MAWAAALIGGWMAKEGADDANKQNAKGGWTDMTTENRPSDQSAGYRNWAMEKAYGILNPSDPTPAWKKPYNNGTPGNRPGAGGASGAGANGDTGPTDPAPTGVLYGAQVPTAALKPGKKGKGGVAAPTKPGKAGKASSGTAAAGDGKWTGTSGNTSHIVDQAIAQADKGNKLYGEAEDYISGTLGGDDRNAYRTETAGMIRDMDDPDLKRLKDLLFTDYEGSRDDYKGTGGRGGGTGPVIYRGTASTPGSGSTATGGYRTQAARDAAAAAEGPVGVVDDLQGILEGQGAPQAVKDIIAKRNEEEWNKRIAEKMGLYVGNGNMGSSNWTQALGDVNTISARELGDSLTTADYGLYQHGLDTGAAYDMAHLDRASRERMAAEDRAASAAASAGASGAAYGMAQLEAKNRMDLARLDALGSAVGMGQRQGEFKTSAMGSLADLYSQDQRFSLGATPDITGLGMRDWTAAGQLSLGSDQNRNSFDIGKRNADAARAGVNATNQRLAFDRERYQHDVPFMDLSRYMDIINSSDRGGSSRTYGQTPSGLGSINSGMAAVGGAAAGWSLGNSFQQTYGGGK